MEVFENLVTLSLSLSDQIRSFCRSKLGTDRRGGEGRPQPPAPSASATPTPIPTLRCATPSSLPLHMLAHNQLGSNFMIVYMSAATKSVVFVSAS